MKRKFVGVLLLVVAMLVSVCAAGAADYTFDPMDYMVTGYSGAGGDVVMPPEIDGCPVEVVDSSVFYGNETITSLTFPDTMLTLGSSNVYFMEQLAQAVLPGTLTAIDDYNFYSCPLLESVVIPSRVAYIGEYCFYSCENLREICFEGETPVIAPECFQDLAEGVIARVPQDQLEAYRDVLPPEIEVVSSGRDAVKHDYTAPEDAFTFDAETGTITAYSGFGVRVDIPQTIGGTAVRAIGDSAFYGHRYMFCVVIPEGVEEIRQDAFASTYHLSNAVLPSTLRTIGDGAFAQYSGKLLMLPEGVETVGDRAFYWSQLQEVYVPAGVVSIGEEAFAGSYVNYLCFDGCTLPEIAPNAFDGLYIEDVDLNWRASKAQMLEAQAFFDGIGQQARVWRMQNPNVDYVQDGLDVYESGVMLGYSGDMTHIRPWDSYDGFDVTAVGDGAFRDNDVIRYFSVPYSDVFTTIGKEAFAGSSVETVDLFDSVTTIGEGAFRACRSLTELTIPASVTYVGAQALADCTALEKLTVLCDPSVLPEGFAEGCSALTQVYAAADATDEQVKALSRAAGLPWYALACRVGGTPRSLIAMPDEPLPEADFWYDEEYARLDNYMGYERNLVLPREVNGLDMAMVGGSVMQRASGEAKEEIELPVRSLVIPETYTEIPYYAFANCRTLETFVCYAPIETLPEGIFSGCTNLREVVFVNGVRHLEGYLFADCPALETVYLGEFVEQVSESAFYEFDGTEAFALERCIMDSAQMPDVQALLEAVKSEPMPVPEPDPQENFGSGGEEGEPGSGIWKIASIAAKNAALDLAERGVTMFFEWVQDASPAPQEESLSGQEGAIDLPARFGRKYVCTSFTAAGDTHDAAILGAEYSMQFDEAGTMDLCLSGMMMDNLPWREELVDTAEEKKAAFVITYMDALEYVAVLTDTGFDMDYYGAMLLHFEAAQ